MKKNNIIAFERGAEFYFDLGYRKIQKGNLKSALRYMEKAVRLKPNDSFIQFNYAGLLAELGDVGLSTEILLKIVNELDPNYDECYFGLACNYLQMQKIKKSVEYFDKYLKKEPEGEFSEEAEELLEMLNMIKDANNNLEDEELERIYAIEEEAIANLEKHQYKEAALKFEQVVNLLPNAVPARNNLSLTYYYLEDIQKAIELAREVLNYEKYNIHANCNLAIFYKKLGLSNWVDRQLKEIKKISTDNPEYMYKIADTLGMLDKHIDAYKVYKKLLSLVGDNILYTHYTAVAAFNSSKYNDSIKYWKKLKQLDNQNLLSDFYIALAQSTAAKAEPDTNKPILTYSYQLPKEEIEKRVSIVRKFLDSSTEAAREMLKGKSEEEALYFSILFDKLLLRKLIFNKIKTGLIIESQKIIRKILLSSDLEDEIKVEAVFLLDIIGAPQPYKVNFAGEIMEITADPLSIDIYAINGKWEDIIKKTHKSMKGLYKGAYKRAVSDMWMAFVKYRYPDIPQINKIEEWAAALEYVYCKLNNIRTNQKNVAKKYEISPAAIGNKYKEIMESVENRADYEALRKK